MVSLLSFSDNTSLQYVSDYLTGLTVDQYNHNYTPKCFDISLISCYRNRRQQDQVEGNDQQKFLKLFSCFQATSPARITQKDFDLEQQKPSNFVDIALVPSEQQYQILASYSCTSLKYSFQSLDQQDSQTISQTSALLKYPSRQDSIIEVQPQKLQELKVIKREQQAVELKQEVLEKQRHTLGGLHSSTQNYRRIQEKKGLSCDQLVKMLMDGNWDLNSQENSYEDSERWLLMSSDYGKYDDLIIKLLKASANLGLDDQQGQQILYLAILQKKDVIVEKLIDIKVSVKLRHLMLAIEGQDENLVQQLIHANVINNFKKIKGLTALLYAVKKPNLKIVQILLDARADSNMKCPNGLTPLMIAVKAQNIELIMMLIKTKCNVNSRGEYGMTALMMISNMWSEDPKKIQIVDILIQAQADVNIQSDCGNTALHYAVRQKLYTQETIIRVLLNADICVNVQNNNGLSALMIACQDGNSKVIHQLLDVRALVNLHDINKQNALMLYIQLGCTFQNRNVYNRLIMARAGINSQDDKGRTALMLAVINQVDEITYVLLDANADVNIQDDKGNTALMAAIDQCNAKLVQRILTAKADINVQNINGQTALMLLAQAQYKGETEGASEDILQMLLDKKIQS